MTGQRNHMQMTLTTITSLGNELIEKILQHVCANSFKDLFNAKKVCKLFQEICEADSIYKAVELSNFRVFMKIPKVEEEKFLDMCYAKNNPEAIYNKGVQYYFLHNQTIEGLHLLKRAADEKFDRAVYIYAMLQRTLGEAKESENYLKRLTRNGAMRIKQEIMCEADGGWDELLPATFVERRDSFDSTVVGCYCKILEDSLPRRKKRARITNRRSEYLCDECFWHSEHKMFLQHFPKHINFWYI